MSDPARVVATLRLGPGHALRLLGWKAWQAGMRGHERRTGHRRYHRAAAEFLARWRALGPEVDVAAWLDRPGAGRFFITPAEAPEWCRATCTPDDIALADAAVAGRFDLIGSGLRNLGDPPRWRTDLYTGIEWPLDDAQQLRIVRNDGSDIRTVWELSRAYHVIALARAYWATGGAHYARTFVRHVDSWIEQNPYGRGPHWASPMDAAIRSANWTLGLLLLAPAAEVDGAFAGRMLSNLYATARFVERHREWHPVFRGNHFVANGVGLAYAGALFRDDARGARWLQRGARILARELLRQVHPDGVSFEGSLGYHRFAAQLFGWGGELVRRNVPGEWTADHERRLAAMGDFIEAYLPASGLAPLIGDNDDGHLHVLDAGMLKEPRRHRLGLPARGSVPEATGLPDRAPGAAAPTSRAQLYRDGGFAVLRHGQDHCVIRCGAIGLHGAGSHDHNDQLSFELVIDGQRIVRDSGTYCYTRDLEQRFRFRATAAHSAWQLAGEEQNPISAGSPWRILAHRTRSRVIECGATAAGLRFRGEHHGYAHLPGAPRVEREIEFESGDREWRMTDQVTAGGAAPRDRQLAWRLHLAGEAVVGERSTGRIGLSVGGVQVLVSFPAGLNGRLEMTPSSGRYGEQVPQPVLVLAGDTSLPARIVTRFRPAGLSAPTSGPAPGPSAPGGT